MFLPPRLRRCSVACSLSQPTLAIDAGANAASRLGDAPPVGLGRSGVPACDDGVSNLVDMHGKLVDIKGMPTPAIARVRTPLKLDTGDFHLSIYETLDDGGHHLALVRGRVEGEKNVLCRIHSECLTGDLLSSKRCDCGGQFQDSLECIAKEETGILIYLRQEGRGIGLLDKLRAYNLQDRGYDTVEANEQLGHPADGRSYAAAASILKSMGVVSVRVMTNNLAKIAGLEDSGVEVEERIPLAPRASSDNLDYLKTKISKLGHKLRVNPTGSGPLIEPVSDSE